MVAYTVPTPWAFPVVASRCVPMNCFPSDIQVRPPPDVPALRKQLRSKIAQWIQPPSSDKPKMTCFDLGMPDIKCAVDYPHQSLVMDAQPLSDMYPPSDMPLSLTGAPSYDLGQLFECESNSGLEFQRSAINFSDRLHQNHQWPCDTTLQSHNSPTGRKGSPLAGYNPSALSSQSRASQVTPLGQIIAMPTSSSPAAVEGIDSNKVDKGGKKVRQKKRLTPKARQEKSIMRTLRSCAPCFASHIKVGEMSCIW